MEEIKKDLEVPTDRRVYTIAQALHEKATIVPDIHDITKIDHWFPCRLEDIAKVGDSIEVTSLNSMSNVLIMMDAKQLGYSDKQISSILVVTEHDVCAK